MPVSVVLTIVALAYALGAFKPRSRTTGNRLHKPIRALAMGGGLLIIYIALASPLDDLADQMLSAHMVQHLLLMLLAAPLLVWAHPMPVLMRSPPLPIRKAIARLWNKSGLFVIVRALERPAASWIVFCGIVIVWHVPAVYRWAVGGEIRHSLMHLSFLGSGLLFWSVVLEPAGRRRLNYVSSALYVFSAALITGLPGALIAFTQRTIYVAEPHSPLPFGLTVLADQQLAGLLMWIPMDLVLFGVALALFAAALGVRRIDYGTRTVTTATSISPN
jgi:cytochrome c oxidase assembly factor CtaG